MEFGYIDIETHELYMLIKDDEIAALLREIKLLKEELAKKQ